MSRWYIAECLVPHWRVRVWRSVNTTTIRYTTLRRSAMGVVLFFWAGP